MHNLTIKLTPDGTATAVYHPTAVPDAITQGIGSVVADARGGYCLPASPLKRAAFVVLRALFGGKGRIAAWTREWRGNWIVKVAATGQVLPGRFHSHAEAVKAEVAWLLQEEQ